MITDRRKRPQRILLHGYPKAAILVPLMKNLARPTVIAPELRGAATPPHRWYAKPVMAQDILRLSTNSLQQIDCGHDTV